jgi:hypothetical protein
MLGLLLATWELENLIFRNRGSEFGQQLTQESTRWHL